VYCDNPLDSKLVTRQAASLTNPSLPNVSAAIFQVKWARFLILRGEYLAHSVSLSCCCCCCCCCCSPSSLFQVCPPNKYKMSAKLKKLREKLERANVKVSLYLSLASLVCVLTMIFCV